MAQGGPLVDAEAVLLVGDDKAEMLILYVLRQQGVGADAHVDLAAGKPGQDLPPLFGLGGACQKSAG